MRALIYIPITHGPGDLGSLAQAVSDSRTPEQVEQYQAAVDHFWTLVETTIEGFGLDYRRVRLYQDGLPVCGKEMEIVNNTAASGSRNFLLLQQLVGKGATIMGTESPDLLLEEYAMMRQLHNPQSAHSPPSQETAKALLDKRDEFIAKRIEETLGEEEMGVLFMGLLHDVAARISKGITLIQPFGKPRLG